MPGLGKPYHNAISARMSATSIRPLYMPLWLRHRLYMKTSQQRGSRGGVDMVFRGFKVAQGLPMNNVPMQD